MCQITSGAASWKMKFCRSAQNSQGTCPMLRATSSEDSRSIPKTPWSRAGQSKCAKSHQEPPAEKWSLAGLLETHRWPAPWWGLPSLKMASPYHHPLRSSTGVSKCAKLHLELQAVHHPHESGGALLLSPLAQIPLKTEPGPICLKLTGDLPHGEGNIPWRQQVNT